MSNKLIPNYGNTRYISKLPELNDSLIFPTASHGLKKLGGEKLIDIHNTHQFEICNSLNLHSGITNYILALPASIWIQSTRPTSFLLYGRRIQPLKSIKGATGAWQQRDAQPKHTRSRTELTLIRTRQRHKPLSGDIRCPLTRKWVKFQHSK